MPLLVEARHRMFEDLDGGGDWIGQTDRLLTPWLEERFADGRASGFIAEDGSGAFVGAISVAHEDTPPSRGNPAGRQSYLFGLWVGRAWRRRGIAKALVTAAVQDARELGEGAVTLFASDEGRRVYERLGFHSSPHMRTFLAPLDDPDSPRQR